MPWSHVLAVLIIAAAPQVGPTDLKAIEDRGIHCFQGENGSKPGEWEKCVDELAVGLNSNPQDMKLLLTGLSFWEMNYADANSERFVKLGLAPEAVPGRKTLLGLMKDHVLPGVFSVYGIKYSPAWPAGHARSVLDRFLTQDLPTGDQIPYTVELVRTYKTAGMAVDQADDLLNVVKATVENRCRNGGPTQAADCKAWEEAKSMFGFKDSIPVDAGAQATPPAVQPPSPAPAAPVPAAGPHPEKPEPAAAAPHGATTNGHNPAEAVGPTGLGLYIYSAVTVLATLAFVGFFFFKTGRKKDGGK